MKKVKKSSLAVLAGFLLLRSSLSVAQIAVMEQDFVGSDAKNALVASLKKHDTVVPITSKSAEAFRVALQQSSLLVIPDCGSNVTSLGSDVRELIRDFVSNKGNKLLVIDPEGDIVDFVNSIAGSSIRRQGGASDSALNATAASGTPFAQGPSILKETSDVSGVNCDSLPQGALKLYQSSNGHCTVAGFPLGSGSVFIFGWNWEGAAPVGGNDGGWLKLLEIYLGYAGLRGTPRGPQTGGNQSNKGKKGNSGPELPQPSGKETPKVPEFDEDF